MKVCPKCGMLITDELTSYCPEDSTLLEECQIHENEKRMGAEFAQEPEATGNTVNRWTIACVTVIFSVVFLMFAEGDVVTFFTIYRSAVPGALFLSFTIAMILSLIARFFLKRSLGASAQPSSRSNSFALRLLACASSLMLITGCAASCNSQDVRDKSLNKYDYDLVYGKSGDGQFGKPGSPNYYYYN